ncbi:hypothetical protein J6S35_02905 [Candidatus Saccharibacteria bacterium]|nr:hypothetical protein [Candidatus Saccharibacteria bacterium]
MSTKNSKVTKKSTTKPTRKGGKKIAPPNKPLCLIALIILGVAGLIVASFLIIYTVMGNNSRVDSVRFANEYSSVSDKNPFVYRTGEEIVDILEHGTGVVYLGFPSCPWCQAYVGYMNEAAQEVGLDKIYYYNIEQDRKDNTELYQKLVSILSSYLQFSDEGQRRIYVPNVTFVVDGKIIGNDLESSKYTAGESDPANYWTEARVNDLKTRLISYMQVVKDAGGCTESCNE